VPATAPEDVAKVIAEGRRTHPAMALYLWLAAITGARRGELCALQVCDVDLENGVLRKRSHGVGNRPGCLMECRCFMPVVRRREGPLPEE
jgi:integrase